MVRTGVLECGVDLAGMPMRTQTRPRLEAVDWQTRERLAELEVLLKQPPPPVPRVHRPALVGPLAQRSSEARPAQASALHEANRAGQSGLTLWLAALCGILGFLFFASVIWRDAVTAAISQLR
jgi:hypothetical protein